MATTFEPSLSTSAMRAPYSTAEAPSMADSLPSINFGFEELRERMARFSSRFDDFIEKGRKRVLEERNQFRMNIAELQEDQRQKQRDIEITHLKSSTHAQTLSKEAAETTEMHSAINALTSTKQTHQSTNASLASEIAAVKKQIASRRAAQASHRQALAAQSRINPSELQFWESHLCMAILGAGIPDRLKFAFTHVHEKEWERECWFELGTGTRDYSVHAVRPKLEREAVDGLVDRLNETRELVGFLKGMRGLFVEALK
ncbi:hypothetical protein K402DRAFT_379860 [Aulographum hederae CBS 113979]|uniref:Kinetochore protein SPC25 n=1 Tax=Aulographum hederae CBS 113979 TaxID=1176131 RepID=A0A6G1GVR7_9PEZI|nr:hypothetical protein K402DRAFT_379860 [Aulographum hederae CBS 113979]